MFKKIVSQKYGHKVFYIKLRPLLWLSVYQVDCVFSTVGVAWVFVLHISYRHLHRLKRFKWADRKTVSFERDIETGNKILNELKQRGKTDISHLFSRNK